MASIITAHDLNLWYGDFKALKGISLDVGEQEITALIGPSGCGKSTFLKTLNRMNDLVPNVRIEGDVRLRGEDIFSKEMQLTDLRRRVGMVFQKANPFPMSIYGVMHMRILGVDPGIATVGFAVLDAEKRSQRLLTCGVITTPAKTQLSSRLDQIYRDLNELIAQFHPEVMAVEELFFNTNITTGIAVAHGRGIILLSGYQAGLQIYEYTPLQVKQAVVGYGRADKKQVMDMVRRILSLQAVPKPDDAADAVAIALCHARSATSLIHQQERFDPCSTI